MPRVLVVWSDTPRPSLRRAAANKGLLITLGVVALLAAGFWLWVWRGTEPPLAADPSITYPLWCENCKKEVNVPIADAEKLPSEGRMVQCPECKQFKGSWDRPGTVSVTVPGGG
jgi:DNA-directed RNA polymerase subunit RPC12/RpoP